MDPSAALAFLESKRAASQKQDDSGLLALYNMKFGASVEASDQGFQEYLALVKGATKPDSSASGGAAESASANIRISSVEELVTFLMEHTEGGKGEPRVTCKIAIDLCVAAAENLREKHVAHEKAYQRSLSRPKGKNKRLDEEQGLWYPKKTKAEPGEPLGYLNTLLQYVTKLKLGQLGFKIIEQPPEADKWAMRAFIGMDEMGLGDSDSRDGAQNHMNHLRRTVSTRENAFDQLILARISCIEQARLSERR